MDFTLSEEHKMLQAAVRDLAAKQFVPAAEELDKKQEFAWDNFKKMAELGLVGMAIPTEYGGSGGDALAAAIAIEEVSRACAASGDILNAHHFLGTEPIYIYGNEDQRKKYLPALAKGERAGSFAVTEPDAGSDIASIQTTAVRDGDSYIINGTKIFITNGDICGNVVLFARILELERRGMTAFIIEDGMPGFKRGKKFDKLGMRAGTAAELVFEDCRVPAANRLGEEGQGMRICLATLDRGRIGVAAQGIDRYDRFHGAWVCCSAHDVVALPRADIGAGANSHGSGRDKTQHPADQSHCGILCRRACSGAAFLRPFVVYGWRYG